MANEREDRYESQDEGEYHFSDDQSTYELEPDIETEAEAEAPKPAAAQSAAKGNALVKIAPYRRMIIGVVVFVVLLLVVYKMIVPAALAPATEFTETTTTTTKTPPKLTEKAPAASPAPAAPAAPQAVIPVQQPNPIAAPTATPSPFPETNPSTAAAPAPGQPVMPPAPVVSQLPAAPTAPPGMPSPPAPVEMAPAQATTTYTVPAQQGAIVEKLASMEAETSQKLTEYQAQNAALETKVRELNTRLANMEATLNQLTQAILNRQLATGPTSPPPLGAGPVGLVPVPAVTMVSGAKMGEPKMAYTVQAIIPGRAWLKSDAGDTITVAEGDILKDYGRVTKIDPYDGIVVIDTGGKNITLSYGAGSD